MDAAQQIAGYDDFIVNEGLDKLSWKADSNFIEVNFDSLAKFRPDLAELILDEPVDAIKALEIAFDERYKSKKISQKGTQVLVKDIPESSTVKVRGIRDIHLNKLIHFEGTIRFASGVLPVIIATRFECPQCANIITVIQREEEYREPQRCTCGRKGKFRKVSDETNNRKKLIIAERHDTLDKNQQPQSIRVHLWEHLTDKRHDLIACAGNDVVVTGIVKYRKKRKGKVVSNECELYIESLNIRPSHKDYSELELTQEDKDKIKEFASKPNIVKILTDSLSPRVVCDDKLKEALLLSMFGGPRATGKNENIHLLIISDPSMGKTLLLEDTCERLPKSFFTSGEGASGIGLTATVGKNDALDGEWVAQAGAAVLANKGHMILDEIDKLRGDEERNKLHSCMASKKVNLAKASVVTTLSADTTIIAAGNPKSGRFSEYDGVHNQIKLSESMLSRFHIILTLRDAVVEEKDREIIRKILGSYRETDEAKELIDNEFFRKYVAFARKSINPKIPKELEKDIEDYYVSFRQMNLRQGDKTTIPITHRQAESVILFLGAYARMRMSEVPNRDDFAKAKEMLKYILKTHGQDPDTGKVEYDTITGIIPSSERQRQSVIMDTLRKLVKEFGEGRKPIPYDDVEKEVKDKGITADQFEKSVADMIHKTDIMEPKSGFLIPYRLD